MISKNDTDKGATSGSCRFCFVMYRKSIGFSKGVLLGCKRVRFGLQKESFWRVKGVLSECKRSPFENKATHLNTNKC